MASELSALIRAINSMSDVVRGVVGSNKEVVSAIKLTNSALNIGMSEVVCSSDLQSNMNVPHGTRYDLDAKLAKAVAGAKSTEDILPDSVKAEISNLSKITRSVTEVGENIRSVTDDLRSSSNDLLHTLTGTVEYYKVLKASTSAINTAESTLNSSISNVADIVKTSSDQSKMVHDMTNNLSKAIEAVTAASGGLSFNLSGANKQVDAMIARTDKVDKKVYQRGLEIKEEIEQCSAEIREYMAPMLQRINCLEGKLSSIMTGELKISDVGGQSVASSNRRKG